MARSPSTTHENAGKDAEFREEYDRLGNRIVDWMRIAPGDESESDFNRLALDVFEFQVRRNPAYANYCRVAGQGEIRDPASWREIPAAPADAFRNPGIPLACFPPGAAGRCFETSGTTSETPGRHYFLSTGLYRQSILLGWRELALPELPSAVLVPSPDAAPNSSLSYMLGTLADEFGKGDASYCITGKGTIDVTSLEERCEAGDPILLLGTALSFLHLFEILDTATAKSGRNVTLLPPGSRAMETGGYKGTRRHIAKEDLYALFEKHLGLPAGNIINEYGMTELSSQFYATGLETPHRGPHWTRARVIDPESGMEVAPGETGHLVITDLANLGSVITIATRDLAVRRDDSDSVVAFRLIGRDPGALPRGCSRAADDLLSPSPALSPDS